jgi:hypothetical protein
MTQRESAWARAWRDTASVRISFAWWLGAVLSGAALAVAAYYLAPDNRSLLFAPAGVLVGFFAPYVLALTWKVLGAYGYQPTNGSIG